MIISEPDPTEVMPTTSPPSIPIRTVGTGRGTISWIWPVRSGPVATVEGVAQHHRRGAQQQRGAEHGLDFALRRLGVAHHVQEIGAEEGHRDRAQDHPADELPVDRPLAQVHAAPTGRITTAATRSLEIAADGVTPNSRISIGVISAPPPAPVIPTRKPTIALPMTM